MYASFCCYSLDLASARKLQESINSACELLAEYNARLATEQIDRQAAQKMLADYTLIQKYQLAVTEERLEVRGCFTYF